MVIALAILSVLALCLAAYFAFAKQRTQRALAVAEHSASEQAARAALLEKYSGIPNAETYASKLVDEASVRAAAITRAADDLHTAAEARAGQVVSEATVRASALDAESRRRVETLVGTAEKEANRRVDEAKEQAKQIAGEAYTLKGQVDHLTRTATALKNTIDGYGNSWIVPTMGLLDDLADEFGFAEAGQRLKAARQRVRSMVKDGTAATCDYVEENRKQTAVDFVVDAFNGKVDTILSDVRDDNFGTLEQRIKDAAALVDENGKAFRNARVQPDYLRARIDELKWAVITNELKAKEREEQRLLRERIREEEKAQREFEKAQREAEKEEDVIRKAMEKAQREIAKAKDEDRVKFEAQLAELQGKLQAAEEKNKRALSMAQQTKAGHVYVISNVGSFGENVFKIGLTRRLEPMDRIKELGDASVPFEFDVHALIRADDAPALEHELHKRFVMRQMNKVNARKEFFRVSVHEIRDLLDGLGYRAQWTLMSDCREWREPQALERALENNTVEEGAWAKRQIEEHDRAMAAPSELEAEVSELATKRKTKKSDDSIANA